MLKNKNNKREIYYWKLLPNSFMKYEMESKINMFWLVRRIIACFAQPNRQIAGGNFTIAERIQMQIDNDRDFLVSSREYPVSAQSFMAKNIVENTDFNIFHSRMPQMVASSLSFFNIVALYFILYR